MKNVIAMPVRPPTLPAISPAAGGKANFAFDAGYVQALRLRDPAVEHHFCVYFGDLLTIKLRSRVRSAQVMEDVRQETMLRVLRSIRNNANGLEHPDRLGAFVHAVCNNVLLEAFRSECRFHQCPDNHPEPLDYSSSADGQFVTDERKRQIAKVLRELPKREASLLREIFLEDRDKEDICERFGIDRNYLRVLLHRARQRFREIYTKAYEVPF